MNTYAVIKQLYQLIKVDKAADNINPAFKAACEQALDTLDNLKKFY